MGRKADNLTGQRFGNLIVIKQTGINKSGNACWLCKCDCEKEVVVSANNLKREKTKSCGCLKSEDLTGQRFEKLTVIERAGIDKNGNVRWLCKCDCGKEVTVSTNSLKSGNTRSCGCLRVEDLAGQRFGNLTVIKHAGTDKNGNARWFCRCDCGKETMVSANNLKNGSTKSCGCLRVEDLTGQRFGNLTVVEQAGTDKYGHIHWLCKCGCGKEVTVSTSSLKSGHTKSCGCLRIEDLTGQRFGSLTVIEQAGTNKYGHTRWLCRCDCGKEVTVCTGNLKSGCTKSCGCLRIEDLTGQRFGSLTVIERDGTDKNRHTRWLCRCDCGKETTVSANDLKSGNTKSCGCNKTPYGEEFIKEYLDSIGFVEDRDYRRQVKFDGLLGSCNRQLSYDFEILKDTHCLIEYQGEQHFKAVEWFGGEEQFSAQLEHDRIKADYALLHGIPLYYIDYTENTYQKVEAAMRKILNMPHYSYIKMTA